MRISLMLVVVMFLASCENDDKNGTCYGYDENNLIQDCIKNISASECADMDSNNEQGYFWEFHEGEKICPPALPEN